MLQVIVGQECREEVGDEIELNPGVNPSDFPLD